MGTRRFTKTLYLRVRPEKHAAALAYAARRGTSITAVVERLLDDLLLHEVLGAPRLRALEERIAALEHCR
jgi:RecB family exonuclease